MQSGWIKLHRAIFDDRHLDGEFSKREAFIWLVAMAATRPTQAIWDGKIISLDRGMVSVSLRHMASEWGWSVKRVRTMVSNWKKLDKIGLEMGTGITVITICNYNKYQDAPEKGAQQGHSMGTGRAQVGHNKKEEEVEVEEKDTSYLPHVISERGGNGHAKLTRTEIANMVADEWNKLAGEHGLPKVQKMTRARSAAAAARYDDAGGIEGIRAGIARVPGNKWLLGENDRGWRANFDWFVREGSFAKLMEGIYDNPTDTPRDWSWLDRGDTPDS